MQETKPPQQRDELIDYLAERLSLAEDAINEACDCINNEWMRRKALATELQEKNTELKTLVLKEKRSLKDKVHTEIEKSLGQAIKAKIIIEKERDELKRSLGERDMLFEELDYQYGMIREEIHQVRVLKDTNIKQMEENNTEIERIR